MPTVGVSEDTFALIEDIITMSQVNGDHIGKSMAVTTAVRNYHRALLTQHKVTEYAQRQFGVAGIEVIQGEDRG